MMATLRGSCKCVATALQQAGNGHLTICDGLAHHGDPMRPVRRYVNSSN